MFERKCKRDATGRETITRHDKWNETIDQSIEIVFFLKKCQSISSVLLHDFRLVARWTRANWPSSLVTSVAISYTHKQDDGKPDEPRNRNGREFRSEQTKLNLLSYAMSPDYVRYVHCLLTHTFAHNLRFCILRQTTEKSYYSIQNDFGFWKFWENLTISKFW